MATRTMTLRCYVCNNFSREVVFNDPGVPDEAQPIIGAMGATVFNHELLKHMRSEHLTELQQAEQHEAIARALTAKYTSAQSYGMDVRDIVRGVVADTMLILDGTLKIDDFRELPEGRQ